MSAVGVIGRKCGMTQVFTEDGEAVPVTVIAVDDNVVVQVKSEENDGYSAIQVKAGQHKTSHVTKPLAGHYAKANVAPGKILREFLVNDEVIQANNIAAGVELNVDQFNVGQEVDVTSISKGKGFAGTVKRYNFKMQRATHGNSLAHRVPGSTGQNQTPGKVFKGKKMPGQMGNKRCTVQNQKIIRIDAERNILLVKGTVPGAQGSRVIVKPAVKKIHSTEENN